MSNVVTEEKLATFAVPGDVLDRFLASVPEESRDPIVADLMRAEVERREAALIAACETANADPEAAAVEADFQAFDTPMAEPWEEA